MLFSCAILVPKTDYTKKGVNDMPSEKIVQDVQQFCDLWQGLNTIYEDYARTQEMPYTNLYILNLLTRIENCTQKIICERTLLPKQTVNTVITCFYKNGWVELREIPEDRRIKSIHLTSDGLAYAGKVIPPIREAEIRAMERLTEEQRVSLLHGMGIYCEAFREEMFSGK
jgi:Transcriptional regulators